MDWTDERIDFQKWKRVPGNPFADYDAAEGIALWSLWEMPSSSLGKLVRRGRARPKLVRLDEDVASAFEDDAAVNEALRLVLRAKALPTRSVPTRSSRSKGKRTA